MRRHAWILIFVFCMALGMAGCGTVPRAFDQQERADVLMRFYSWNDFQLLRPEVLVPDRVSYTRLDGVETVELRPVPTTREGFVGDLGRYTGRRNLAVVVFDKRLAVEQAEREAATADLENLFKHFGFQHVSFQQDMDVLTADGLPILREY